MKEIRLQIILIGIMFLGVYFMLIGYTEQRIIVTVDKVYASQFRIREVSSKSNSMSPIIDTKYNAKITTNNRVLGEDEQLKLGKIYIYKKTELNETKLIIHRLIGKYVINNETKYVFKGDNNFVADYNLVNRSQVLEEVIQINLG